MVKRRDNINSNEPLFTPAREYEAIMELVEISRARTCTAADVAEIASRGREVKVPAYGEPVTACLRKWNLSGSSTAVAQGNLRFRRALVAVPDHRQQRSTTVGHPGSAPVLAFIVNNGRGETAFMLYLDAQSAAYRRMMKAILDDPRWAGPLRGRPKHQTITVVGDVGSEQAQVPDLFADMKRGLIDHPYAESRRLFGDSIKLYNDIPLL